AAYSHPFPYALKKRILAVCQGQQTTLSEIGRLDYELGTLFADADDEKIAQTLLNPHKIKKNSCHGQTVWHEPDSET
ncbi:anhydro-N-acetylmuramic acid kinase, partial [Morganella morganii]